MFNLVYYYTYITFYLQKLYNYFFNFFPKEPVTSLLLIKNNNSKEICKNELSILSPTVFDFIIYNDANNNHILYFYIPISFEYICCSYKFISVNINISESNTNYNIDLKGYYIVGNKFTKEVFYYLLNLQHNVVYNSSYTLTIIDSNVKIIQLDELDTIILDINEYHLKKN